MSHDAIRTTGLIGFGLRRMVEEHPLHAALVDGWRVVSNARVPTMAVSLCEDLRIELNVNPEFVVGLTPDELVNVLLHESYHVLFSHLAMPREQYPDHAALIVAQEVTVNEFIRGPLPGSPLRLEQFSNLPAFETTEARYARLRGLCHGNTSHAWCGIRSGPVGQDAWRVLMASDVRDAIKRLPEGLRRRATADLAGLAERVGGSVAERALFALPDGGRSRADWRSIVRRFVWTLTQPTPSRHRPSRRFPALVGIVAGRYRTAWRPRIMVVIDTSGSMVHARILAAIRAELRELAVLADLLIVECDAKVRREYRYAGDIVEVVGGGGTSFCEPLSEEFLKPWQVDGVVYFTDGEGRAPVRTPLARVLWCLLGRAKSPAPWGDVVRLAVRE